MKTASSAKPPSVCADDAGTASASDQASEKKTNDSERGKKQTDADKKKSDDSKKKDDSERGKKQTDADKKKSDDSKKKDDSERGKKQTDADKKKSDDSKKKDAPRVDSSETADSSEQRRLNDGLKATRSQGFLAQIGRLFKGQMTRSVTDELEEILFTADIGVKTSEHLLDKVSENLSDKGDGKAALALLREEVRTILKSCESPFELGNQQPHVILTIGVNGAGKTTTLGKLAAQLTHQGKKVLLIAGDTFRAAAVEQLDEWATRCGCGIYKKQQGADPSGTIFDGIKYAQENGYDIALADTAGRLHNKKELIDELKKISRVAGKAMPGAPHQVLLVLDATNGQNALIQARDFGEALPFTGIALTKLDGTAKGGVILGICEEFKKPIYFIGIGEMIDDLRPFKADEFVDALFQED